MEEATSERSSVIVRSSPGRTAEPKARKRQELSSGITLITGVGLVSGL